jgi:hypothetical protein
MMMGSQNSSDYAVTNMTTNQPVLGGQSRISDEGSSDLVGTVGIEAQYRPWGLSFIYTPSFGGKKEGEISFYSIKWTKKWGGDTKEEPSALKKISEKVSKQEDRSEETITTPKPAQIEEKSVPENKIVPSETIPSTTETKMIQPPSQNEKVIVTFINVRDGKSYSGEFIGMSETFLRYKSNGRQYGVPMKDVKDLNSKHIPK